MPRKCIVCGHDKRLRIDKMIVQGVAIAKIALQFDIAYMNVYSHSRHHLSRQLLKSHSMKQTLDLDNVSHEFQSFYERMKELFNRLEGEEISHVHAAIAKELRAGLESLAKWGISLNMLSQQDSAAQAQQEANSAHLSMRDAIALLTQEELQTFQFLMAKMQGENPGTLPRLESPRQQTIDVTPTPVSNTAIQHHYAPLDPVIEEAPPPKRERTNPPQPGKQKALRARREIARKMGMNQGYEVW
jgi:hypothetical protein